MTKLTPKVLKLDPLLAQSVGLNEAIVISQVDHYLKLASKNDKFKTDDDGTKWTYNSLREWEIQFPFWSKDTIGRIFRRLEKMGLLKSRSRARRGERKWSFEYTLNYEKLASIPEVKCCTFDTKTENQSNVALLIQRDSQMLQICDKEPENTKRSNTKTSFAKKQDEATYVEQGENTARPISHDDLTADMSSNELADLQNKYPNLDEERLQSYFIQQKGYWLGKYKTRAELMGKVEALIAQESRKTKVAFQDPSMSPFYRGMRVSVQE